MNEKKHTQFFAQKFDALDKSNIDFKDSFPERGLLNDIKSNKKGYESKENISLFLEAYVKNIPDKHKVFNFKKQYDSLVDLQKVVTYSSSRFYIGIHAVVKNLIKLHQEFTSHNNTYNTKQTRKKYNNLLSALQSYLNKENPGDIFKNKKIYDAFNFKRGLFKFSSFESGSLKQFKRIVKDLDQNLQINEESNQNYSLSSLANN